ncbi:hypothetical protein GCM10011316_23810 [Roseibium aquae]|uniref:DUF3168 domain-containing protein n=1 Tax=Roseibium aquae TaxID=1323746 RepID=A0A916X166_9HYPH|nr:DUF3168 domain-containing protein [Roseibium aquae]GGB50984.1 hypothetical protein GCM10011316_23810 [Roseibium aquae]
MSGASLQSALRAGLFACLAQDGTLTGLLGGTHLYDTPPRGQDAPHLVLQTAETRPLLADPQDGFIHDLMLSVFTRGASRDLAVHVAHRAAETLMHGPVTVAGHRLVNLTITSVSSRRLRDARGYQAAFNLRAVTEPSG